LATLLQERQGKRETIMKTILLMFVVVALLTSCSGSPPTHQVSSTNTFEAALSEAYTEFAEIQTAIPTVTPAATQSATIPRASFTVIPPAPDEQVYMDPEGWYSVNFPADMRLWDKPNSFVGNTRIFETGYLPYMSRPMNLCLWLANVVAKPEDSAVSWMSPCSVTAKTDNHYNVEYAIYENPLADLEHRFIYVKMGKYFPSIGGYVKHTLSWLRTVPTTATRTTLLSPEEASFWENPDTALSNTSLTEYALPPAGQVGPTQPIGKRCKKMLPLLPKNLQ
jgi:hypothetical protein